MPRYVARQSYDWWPEDNQPTTITVHEDDRFIDTGLLDMHGNRLFRDDSIPMGFQPMSKKPTKTDKLKHAAFREVMDNPPARVKRTKRTKGAKAARKQQIAIALDKARGKGARIPKK